MHKHKKLTLPQRIIAGVATVGLLATGIGTAWAGMGSVSAYADETLPVYNLASTPVPSQYSGFVFNTTNLTNLQLSDVHGMYTPIDKYGRVDDTQPVPRVLQGGDEDTVLQVVERGAGFTLENYGTWIRPNGEATPINVSVRYDDFCGNTQVVFTRRRIQFFLDNKLPPRPFVQNRAQPHQRCFMPKTTSLRVWEALRQSAVIRVTFTTADGSSMDGFQGTTGFTDIDAASDNKVADKAIPGVLPKEAVELLEGFDGLYVRHDAHLQDYGTNGRIGIIDTHKDDDPNETELHGLQHYMAATFSQPEIVIRHSTTANNYTAFQALPSTLTFPFTYNANTQDKLTKLTPQSRTISYNTPADDISNWHAGDTTIRPGYKFTGWAVSSKADTLYDFTTPVTKPTTVYAIWQPNTLTITYDPNGGKGDKVDVEGEYDQPVPTTDKTNDWHKECAKLAGWNTKADGTGTAYTIQDGILTLDGKKVLAQEDMTLYAQWESQSCPTPKPVGHVEVPTQPSKRNPLATTGSSVLGLAAVGILILLAAVGLYATKRNRHSNRLYFTIQPF